MNLVFDPESHRYSLEGVEIPGVSRILDASGFGTKYPPGDYKERGSAVHKASVYIDQGKIIKVGEGIDGYLTGYRAFLRDFHVQWSLMEYACFHPTLLYGGTLDRFGSIDGRPLLLDIKTGTPPLPRLSLQLAAYALIVATRNCLRWGLELTADGRYKIHVCNDPLDYDVFIGLVNRIKWGRG